MPEPDAGPEEDLELEEDGDTDIEVEEDGDTDIEFEEDPAWVAAALVLVGITIYTRRIEGEARVFLGRHRGGMALDAPLFGDLRGRGRTGGVEEGCPRPRWRS
jgi:hypothetical protein